MPFSEWKYNLRNQYLILLFIIFYNLIFFVSKSTGFELNQFKFKNINKNDRVYSALQKL